MDRPYLSMYATVKEFKEAWRIYMGINGIYKPLERYRYVHGYLCDPLEVEALEEKYKEAMNQIEIMGDDGMKWSKSELRSMANNIFRKHFGKTWEEINEKTN